MNWSGLCTLTGCCNAIHHISHFRYFRICGVSDQGTKSISIYVKDTSEEAWSEPRINGQENARSILKFEPDITVTPPEPISARQDEKDVLDKIESKACRIRPRERLDALKELVERVYSPRQCPIHWDLSNCVETVEDPSSLVASSAAEAQQAVLQCRSGFRSSFYFTYDIGSFVCVNGGDDEHHLDFWVWEVTDRKMSDDKERIISVSVIWYISHGSADIYNSRYKPWPAPYKDGIDSFWKDEISVETIHSNFPSLTKEKRLPMSVTNYINSIVSKRRKPSTTEYSSKSS